MGIMSYPEYADYNPDNFEQPPEPVRYPDPIIAFTRALNLREAVVNVRPNFAKCTEEITVVVGFTTRVSVDSRFLMVDSRQATMDVVRDAMLDSMLAYLQEHNSKALKNLLMVAELRSVVRAQQEHKTPEYKDLYPSDRGKPDEDPS